jgi:hypothetical protein
VSLTCCCHYCSIYYTALSLFFTSFSLTDSTRVSKDSGRYDRKIRQERRQDPEGIPDNAEGIVEAIVKQEMERMMTSVNATRAKERLQE